MKDQHKLIQTYRDLTQAEIDLINKIKVHEAQTLALHKEVAAYVGEQYDEAVMADNIAEMERLNGAEPRRWSAVAKTDLQTGFMALVRAVAQPGEAKLVAVEHE